jgi:hypothetical protein
MTIEIVDFPIKNDGSFHGYVAVYQRVNHHISRMRFYGDVGKKTHRDFKKVSSFLQAFSSTVQKKPPNGTAKRWKTSQDSLFVFGGLIVWDRRS